MPLCPRCGLKPTGKKKNLCTDCSVKSKKKVSVCYDESSFINTGVLDSLDYMNRNIGKRMKEAFEDKED